MDRTGWEGGGASLLWKGKRIHRTGNDQRSRVHLVKSVSGVGIVLGGNAGHDSTVGIKHYALAR